MHTAKLRKVFPAVTRGFFHSGNPLAAFLQTRYGSWGISGAGAELGKSIERATSNVVDKVQDKMLPEIAKMLSGEDGLSPQLLKGFEKIADKSLGTMKSDIIPETARQISEQIIPRAGSEMREAGKSVADHVVPTIRKELQQMISSIRFENDSHPVDPTRQSFDLLCESFLSNGIRYLDCHALGEGYKIRTGWTDGKDNTTSMTIQVFPGGLVVVEYFLEQVFVTDRALLRMSSISPLFQFHMPEKGDLHCRCSIPQDHIHHGALFTLALLRWIHEVLLPVVESITGDEKREDILRQVRERNMSLVEE